MAFFVQFTGKKIGAIGKSEHYVAIVNDSNINNVIPALYSKFEHVFLPCITCLATGIQYNRDLKQMFQFSPEGLSEFKIAHSIKESSQ